jgi:hypothetical protein
MHSLIVRDPCRPCMHAGAGAPTRVPGRSGDRRAPPGRSARHALTRGYSGCLVAGIHCRPAPAIGLPLHAGQSCIARRAGRRTGGGLVCSSTSDREPQQATRSELGIPFESSTAAQQAAPPSTSGNGSTLGPGERSGSTRPAAPPDLYPLSAAVLASTQEPPQHAARHAGSHPAGVGVPAAKLAPGTLLSDAKYEIQEVLGSGSNATTYRCKHAAGRLWHQPRQPV